MNNDSFPFKIGDFECIAISDGTFTYAPPIFPPPATFLFTNAPAFPNARYVMWKDEWDFWTSGQAELKLDEHSKEVLLKFARKNLPPIQGQIDLVDHDTEIVPGIHAIAAPGHTPGHMALESAVNIYTSLNNNLT